jgi:hypothetical protein
VHAGGRQLQGPQEVVDLADRPAGDDGDGAAQVAVQRGERLHQAVGNFDLVRLLRDVDQGAVEVEKQRRRVEQEVCKIHGCRP